MLRMENYKAGKRGVPASHMRRMICVIASMFVLVGAGALPISTAAASPSTQIVAVKAPAKEKVTRKVTKKKVTKKAKKKVSKKAAPKKTTPVAKPKTVKKAAPTKASKPAAKPAATAAKPAAKATPIKTYVVRSKAAPAPMPARLRAPAPKATGKTWRVVARHNITTQAQVDRCANTPATWHGYWHVVAHNYCNGWSADAWHGMRRGDRVTLTLPSGQVVTGLVSYDLTIRYGQRWDDIPPPGAGYFSLQTSWRDSIHRDSSHIIVVKRD